VHASPTLRFHPGLLRVSLLAIALTLTAFAQEPRHLVFAGQRNNPPYEYVDAHGDSAGYINDLLRAVAEQEALDIEIRPMIWSEVRGAFERGTVDAVTGMVFSEERARIMDFTIPHSYVPYVIVSQKGDDRIRSERSLLGKDVLVLARSILAEHLTTQKIPFREVNEYEVSIRELASGRCDAVILPKYTYLYFVQKLGIRNLQALPSEIYPTKRCFAVHKGDAALLAKLNEGLFQLKQSGRMDEIYRRHFGALEAKEIPLSVTFRRSLTILVPVVLGLGLMGVLIWSISLRRLVNLETAHLQAALDEVKQLSGLIPICAHCKKIRDDQGYWQAVEGYISAHSEATFTHGLCPDCTEHYFPGVRKGQVPVAKAEDKVGG